MGDRRFWLWVAKPIPENTDYLEPGSTVTDGWWTTHKDTQQGDLALVYLSHPAKAISYLCEITSNAYKEDWNGPSWACEYQTHVRFAAPLDLSRMRADPLLADEFSAMRGYFRQRVYQISPVVWQRLCDLLMADNPAASKTIRTLNRTRVSRSVRRESEIEEALAANLAVLPGRRVRLYQRQFVCDGYGRIDILGRDRKGWVVVELKRGRATHPVVGQIAFYMQWIRENKADAGHAVRGIVVARGSDRQFDLALRAVPDLQFVDLDSISGALKL